MIFKIYFLFVQQIFEKRIIFLFFLFIFLTSVIVQAHNKLYSTISLIDQQAIQYLVVDHRHLMHMNLEYGMVFLILLNIMFQQFQLVF
eukprot:UN04397